MFTQKLKTYQQTGNIHNEPTVALQYKGTPKINSHLQEGTCGRRYTV